MPKTDFSEPSNCSASCLQSSPSWFDNPFDMVKINFFTIGAFNLTRTAIGWFARSRRKWPSTIFTKQFGTALLIVGVLVALDIWSLI